MTDRTPYRTEIEAAARKHGLSADLVEAQVLVESNGNTDAFRYEPTFWRTYLGGKPAWAHTIPRRVSSSYGLLQVMFVVAQELGFTGEPEMLFVPQVGLEWGCLKLSELIDWARVIGPGQSREVQIRSALAAYNGGKARNAPDDVVDRNAEYADKVLRLLRGVL